MLNNDDHSILYTKGSDTDSCSDRNLLNIGFGNSVACERVISIVTPNSAPMKRLKDKAKDENRLIDASCGRRTRSIIVMDSNHIVLSAIQAETIAQRYISTKKSK